MISKKQGMAYAAVTLDLLYKMKVKVNPIVLSEMMELIYDLYEPKEVEEIEKKIKRNNKTIINSYNSKVGCYIINYLNSMEIQKEIIQKCCDNLKLGKIYISGPGENTEIYYELIRDIRNKELDILIMNVYSIYAINEREKNILIHLCRENDVTFIEV